MFKLLKGLGVILAIVFSSIGTASASSINEEIVVSYLSSASFTLSSLSLSIPPGPNLLSFSGGSFAAGSGTVFDETVSLISGDTYTFAFNGSFGSGSAPIFASSSGETGGGSFTFANGAAFNISATLSPVPLPASFPLFALALITLGAIGYRTARTKKNGFAAVGLS